MECGVYVEISTAKDEMFGSVCGCGFCSRLCGLRMFNVGTGIDIDLYFVGNLCGIMRALDSDLDLDLEVVSRYDMGMYSMFMFIFMF